MLKAQGFRFFPVCLVNQNSKQELDSCFCRLLEFSIENTKKNVGHFTLTMNYVDSNPRSNYTAWKWLKLNSAKVDKE